MPFLLDRRGFLTVAAAGASVTRAWAATNAPATWALLSDPHIDADLNAMDSSGANIYTNVSRSVGQIPASGAQICVVPGDVSHIYGYPADYTAFRQLTTSIANRMPMLLTVGNHDNRTNFSRGIATAGVNQGVSGRLVLVLDYNDWRVIMLDSLLATNEPEGWVGSTQRAWLQKLLSRDKSTRTLIFVHHDPGNTDISMADAAQFLNVVVPARQVKAVFFGHQHKYRVTTTSGLHLVQLPSSAYAFDAADPIGWVKMGLSSSGARLTLFANDGNLSGNGADTNLVWR